MKNKVRQCDHANYMWLQYVPVFVVRIGVKISVMFDIGATVLAVKTKKWSKTKVFFSFAEWLRKHHTKKNCKNTCPLTLIVLIT